MDNFFLKLTGKVNVPKNFEIGHNYRVVLDGSVTNEQKSDNEDGTFTYTATFEPIIAEIKKDHGEMVRSKDRRSWSTKIRHMLYRIWEANDDPRPHEQAYEDTMKYVVMVLDDLYDKARKGEKVVIK